MFYWYGQPAPYDHRQVLGLIIVIIIAIAVFAVLAWTLQGLDGGDQGQIKFRDTRRHRQQLIAGIEKLLKQSANQSS